jgi:TadE-like protein
MKNIHGSLTKRTNANGRGQVMIEFALVLPVIVLLLLGAMDLARAVYAYGVIADAARDGARWGSVDPKNWDEVTRRAKAKTASLDPSQIVVGIECPPNGPPGNPPPPNPYYHEDPDNTDVKKDCYVWNFFRVTITYTFQPITLFFVPMKLTSESTMLIE